MMEDAVPIDTDDYQHNQQRIPSSEDGEIAAMRLQARKQREQELTTSTSSTSAVTARFPTRTESIDDVKGVEETTTISPDTSPVVSLTDSLQSRLIISGTYHRRMPGVESLVILCKNQICDFAL